MTETAKKRLAGTPGASRIHCKTGTIEILPFDDESFDLIAGVGPALIFGDRQARMREVYRVLRDGGAALFGGQFRGMPENRRVSSDTLREDAAKTGLPGIRVIDDMGQWVEFRKGIANRPLRD